MQIQSNINVFELSDQQLWLIEEYASVGRSLLNIARLLQVDYEQLKRAYNLPNSIVKERFDRGCELTQVKIDLATKTAALNGSITAMQMMNKVLDKQAYHERKRQILGR